MRAFIALEIPAAVREAVSGRLTVLKSGFPATRWVGPHAYHLTLLFLGEIADDTAERIEESVGGVFGSRDSFAVQLAGGGTFPPHRRARVAWIGLANPEPVVDLGDAVRQACSGLAGGEDRGPFSPHLTVARCRRPWPAKLVTSWRCKLAGAIGEPFRVSRGVLMSSRLGASGARYNVVSAFALAAGGAG